VSGNPNRTKGDPTMARKRSREELEKALYDMGAYQEAFWALQRGEKPVKIENEQRAVWLLGASRSCGGVVWLDPDGVSVHFAERWANDASRSVDSYIADIGRKVFRAVADAIKARMAKDQARVDAMAVGEQAAE
jgi:hypothetical protein